MAIRKKFSTEFVIIGALSRTICSLIISDKNTNGIPLISCLLPGRIFSIIYFIICHNCIPSYKFSPKLQKSSGTINPCDSRQLIR